MEGVAAFVESFKEFPPRSVPPSFNPGTMMEETLRDIKAKQKLGTSVPKASGPGAVAEAEMKQPFAQQANIGLRDVWYRAGESGGSAPGVLFIWYD